MIVQRKCSNCQWPFSYSPESRLNAHTFHHGNRGKTVSPVIALSLAMLLFCSCRDEVVKSVYSTGYRANNPQRTFTLPDSLQEVSGVVVMDSVTVLCIQDEHGIVFKLNLNTNRIDGQFRFHEDGDYEGITRAGDTIYTLRSDGMLFEVTDLFKGKPVTRVYDTGIPCKNNEGLCYDEQNHRLLIACKSKAEKGTVPSDQRVIFSFDLDTHTLSAQPAYRFSLSDINAFASANQITLPTKSKNRKGEKIQVPFLKFRISAVGIHPVTRHLYVLSDVDHMLFVFDTDGNVQHMEFLDPELFNKAEGISFFPNGDMIITNEGQDKQPTMHFFQYQR
jgi:hypothetical protein